MKQVCDNIRDRVVGQAWIQVRASIPEQVRGQVHFQVRQQVAFQVGDQVWGHLKEAVDEAVR
jgi:hypothetical protein